MVLVLVAVVVVAMVVVVQWWSWLCLWWWSWWDSSVFIYIYIIVCSAVRLSHPVTISKIQDHFDVLSPLNVSRWSTQQWTGAHTWPRLTLLVNSSGSARYFWELTSTVAWCGRKFEVAKLEGTMGREGLPAPVKLPCLILYSYVTLILPAWCHALEVRIFPRTLIALPVPL